MSDRPLIAQGSGVWRDLYGYIYRTLRQQGLSHADAEDLAQDILETVYLHLDSIEPERRHAWLMAVTRNKLVDRARRMRRTHQITDVPEPQDPAPLPDEVALASADQWILREVISLLPERDRRLVELRYLEERSMTETAHELGMSMGAARVALHRARERLRTMVEATGVTLALEGSALLDREDRPRSVPGGEAMAGIAERAVRALSPYVGPAVADLCVRGTAVSLDKTFDSLTIDDAGALEHRARSVLASLLPPDAIERVLAEIRGGAL